MLALIPARGGSKGLPGKNLRLLGGLPLIAHTIRAARAAAGIDRVVVSTDAPDIAAVARAFGAETPFLRPSELAGDRSPAQEAYRHALRSLEAQGAARHAACAILLPTAPLRLPTDIEGAVAVFRARRAQAVISVTPASHPPQWARRIDAQGVLRSWSGEDDTVRRNRQELPEALMPNGAIYVLDRALIDGDQGYYGDATYPYLMPRERSIDIDDLLDFRLAELLLAEAAASAAVPTAARATAPAPAP
jgi:CMP-N,N'-diacetyllegionaminic acid synthase